MIITQYKGVGFARVLRYVTQKAGAELLGHNLFCSGWVEQNGVMEATAKQSDRVQKPMIHYAISLAPGESLRGAEWQRLSREYLSRMGYNDNQYLLVRHTDTPNHDHVHLVVNRVQRSSGRAVCLDWDYYQSQAVVRALEAQFNLTSVRSSWEPFEERLLGDDRPLRPLTPEVQASQDQQEKIRGYINEALVVSGDLEQFIGQLEGRGIGVELKRSRGELRGITFYEGDARFSGGKIGAQYSLPKLLKAWDKSTVTGVLVHPETGDDLPPVEESFHQRYYRELVVLVESQRGGPFSQQQVDLQIARVAIRSAKPDAAKALVFSPDVQRLKQEEGEAVAIAYLRELMEEAYRQLKAEKRDQMDFELG